MADKRELETPKVMHDAPLRDSDAAYFHFDDFARTLARLIATKETRTPLSNRSAASVARPCGGPPRTSPLTPVPQ